MNVFDKQPLVSIGLPVYNQPRLMKLALDSLCNQIYKNMEIIVSDDFSPNQEVQNILNDFRKRDDRIKLFRQDTNIGAVLNHKFVQEQAIGDFFFWASEDDEWENNYIETGVKVLLENPDSNAWCCSLDSIDSFGRVICKWEGFSRWTSTEDKSKDIARFLWESEKLGKANIFHSLFRMAALRELVAVYYITEAWGSDVGFGLAFLARNNIIASDEVLIHKRVVRETDCEDKVEMLAIGKPDNYSIRVEYFRECLRAVNGTPYRKITILIMTLRSLVSLRNKFIRRARSVMKALKRMLSAMRAFKLSK